MKLEYSLKLKIKRNDWLLADTVSPRVRKQPIIALYFVSEDELKFITSGPGVEVMKKKSCLT